MNQFSPYAKDIIRRYRRIEPWYGSISIPFSQFQTSFANLNLIRLMECADDLLITEIAVDFLDPLVKSSVFDKKMYRWDQNNTPTPIHAFAGSTGQVMPISTLPIEYFLPAFDDLFFRFQQPEIFQTADRTINLRGLRLKDKSHVRCDQNRESKTIDNGRWIPSMDVVTVGSFLTDANLSADFLLDHSYRVFTQPKPFDWYLFGFAANWAIDFTVDTFIDVADLSVRENMTSRFITGGHFLGVPTNITAGWMPMQIAHHEITGVHKFWAWAEAYTSDWEVGLEVCANRDKPQWIAPYMLPAGKQLRLILQNHCAEDFEDTKLSMIGQRWLPWDAERNPQ
jgi:hypothetical protein